MLNLIIFIALFSLQIYAEDNSTSATNATSSDDSLVHYAEPFKFDDHDRIGWTGPKSLGEIKLDDAIARAQESLSLIYHRYEFGNESAAGFNFIMTANNMPAKTWDMIKYKWAVKITSKENRIFRSIFGGSSVTAGHDNYYYQAYPAIFQKRIENITDALGIDLQTHNIAQTTNNCIPYDMCYESMGGKDPDLVNWEQSYNCGHDTAAFETTARTAGASKSRGIIYYSASGAWLPSNCAISKEEVPYSAEEWTPATAKLTPWKPSKADMDHWKEKFAAYNHAHSSFGRFSSWANAKNYGGLGVLGFNVWEENPLTIHWRGGGKLSGHGIGSTCAEKGGMKFMTKEAAVFGRGAGARWHPSRAFHLLRGEFIAWLFTLPLLDALYMIKEELSKGAKEETLAASYKAKLDELMPPMGAPTSCQRYHCEEKAKCFTDFYPHFPTDTTLSGRVVGKNNWLLVGAEPSEGWHLKYGYRDLKPSIKATLGKPGTEMSLMVSVDKKDFAFICGGALDEASVKFYLDKDGQKNVKQNGSNKDYTFDKSKTTEITKIGGGSGATDCKSLNELPKGDHVITIVPLKTDGAVPSINRIIEW